MGDARNFFVVTYMNACLTRLALQVSKLLWLLVQKSGLVRLLKQFKKKVMLMKMS